jgi:hypothetical protein
MVPKPPSTCPGCKGRGWQKRNDGIKVTCPMCGGSGIFAPEGTPIWMVMPPIKIDIRGPRQEPGRDNKPSPGWEFIPPTPPSPTFPDDPRNPSSWPWWRHSYVGDFPGDWEKPRNTC